MQRISLPAGVLVITPVPAGTLLRYRGDVSASVTTPSLASSAQAQSSALEAVGPFAQDSVVALQAGVGSAEYWLDDFLPAAESKSQFDLVYGVFGDSQAANVNINFGPTGVAYDSASGVLTITSTSHGLYTGIGLNFVVAGDRRWNLRNVPALRIDANTFSLQGPIGLGSGPTTSLCRVIYLTQLSDGYGYTNLAASRPRLVNLGVNQERLDQIRLRIEDAVRSSASVFEIAGGTNDATQANPRSVLAAFNDFEYCVARLVDRGKAVVARTIVPLGTPTAAQGVWILQFNKLVRDLPLRYKNVDVRDDFARVVSPSSAIAAARSGWLPDNIHTGPLAGRVAGQDTESVLSRISAPRNTACPVSDLDGYDATNNPNADNPFDNPLLLVASGGVNGGTIGTVTAIAQGLTCYATGFTSVTANVVSAPDGIGNAQSLVGTPAASGNLLRVTTRQQEAAVAGRVAAGDWYKGVAKVRATGLTGQAVFLRCPLIVVMTTSEGTFTRVYDYNSPATTAAQQNQDDFTIELETPPFQVPAGVTALYIDIQFTAAAAGTPVTFLAWRIGFFKVQPPPL